MQLRGTGISDTSEIKFDCPWCQEEVARLLGDVRRASNLKCEWCQSEIAIQRNVETVISQIETAASKR
jgi:hypothetical protein